MPTVLFSSFPIIADYKDVPVYLEASSSLIRPALFYESTIHCSWRYKMNQAGGSSQIRKWQLLFKQISQKLVMTEDSITLHMHLTLSTISFSKRRCNKITHWKDLGIKKKKKKEIGLLICSTHISRELKACFEQYTHTIHIVHSLDLRKFAS